MPNQSKQFVPYPSIDLFEANPDHVESGTLQQAIASQCVECGNENCRAYCVLCGVLCVKCDPTHSHRKSHPTITFDSKERLVNYLLVEAAR